MRSATGVDVELQLAQSIGTPYFMLAGYDDATTPGAALPTDKLYTWTWDNLKALLSGRR